TYRQASDSTTARTRSIASHSISRGSRDAVEHVLARLPSEVDTDNHLLWRMNRSRLDAESIRDSILFISGKLDLAMGGPSVQQFYFKDDHSPVYDYGLFDVDSPASCRRSI